MTQARSADQIAGMPPPAPGKGASRRRARWRLHPALTPCLMHANQMPVPSIFSLAANPRLMLSFSARWHRDNVQSPPTYMNWCCSSAVVLATISSEPQKTFSPYTIFHRSTAEKTCLGSSLILARPDRVFKPARWPINIQFSLLIAGQFYPKVFDGDRPGTRKVQELRSFH